MSSRTPSVVNIGESSTSSVASDGICLVSTRESCPVGRLLGRPLASKAINLHPTSRKTLPPIADQSVNQFHNACTSGRRIKALMNISIP